jgi:hypothetical protein
MPKAAYRWEDFTKILGLCIVGFPPDYTHYIPKDNTNWKFITQSLEHKSGIEMLGLAHTCNFQLNDCWLIVAHDRGGPTTFEGCAHTMQF